MILYLKKDHTITSDSNVLGVDKENVSEVLEIHVQNDEVLNKWAYLEFTLPNEEIFATPRLDIVDGVISYYVPNSIMKFGYIKFQVVFRDEEDYIWKSFIKQFIVRCAINASDDIAEEHPDFITEAQKILDKCEQAALDVENKVDKSTTINGHSLETDVLLSADDINVYDKAQIDSKELALINRFLSIEALIPTQASSSNKLADEEYVNNHHDSTKQDIISDLSEIRAGSLLGSTAVQPNDISDMATVTWVESKGYLTDIDWIDIKNKPVFALVATTGSYDDLLNKPILFSGDYNDLTNKPTIPVVPTNISAFTNDIGYLVPSDLNGYATEQWVGQQGYLTSVSWTDVSSKPVFATVATSGNYSDLNGTPTIPTVPDYYEHTLEFIAVDGRFDIFITVINTRKDSYGWGVSSDLLTYFRGLPNGYSFVCSGIVGSEPTAIRLQKNDDADSLTCVYFANGVKTFLTNINISAANLNDYNFYDVVKKIQ